MNPTKFRLLILTFWFFPQWAIGVTMAGGDPASVDFRQRYIAICDPALVDLNGCSERLRNRGVDVSKPLPLIHGLAVSIAASSPDSIDSIRQIPGILRLDPDTPHRILGETLTRNIARMGVDQVWDGHTTGRGIRIGILDTGVDAGHRDLRENIAGGYDATGHLDWNDGNGHGTHVAGIVAAVRKNGTGVVGVSPESWIYAIKVLDNSGSGLTSDIIDGIAWCIHAGCQVMNMSFGSPSYNASLQEAIRVAYGAGILIVAAAGDGGSSIAVYPAAYDQVLAVSAIDPSDQITAWSSYGSDVDFAAPGVAVYSTYKNDSYATLSGTSASSPLLAGLAALRIAVYTAHNMAVSPDRITRDLVRSAGDLGSAGWDAYYGYGLVDANILVELPLY